MRKVLFLMFLLLLMVLGAAGVKAQVRIGGNTAPSAAAVLDLNATDAANTGTGGLVLPRVDLKSNVMQLTNGVANQTGTLVYNVTTTLGRIGVYYWNGNSWVYASLPSTTTADSGKFLMSNGNSWVVSTPMWHETTTIGYAVAANSFFAVRNTSRHPAIACIPASGADYSFQSSSIDSIIFYTRTARSANTPMWMMCFESPVSL